MSRRGQSSFHARRNTVVRPSVVSLTWTIPPHASPSWCTPLARAARRVPAALSWYRLAASGGPVRPRACVTVRRHNPSIPRACCPGETSAPATPRARPPRRRANAGLVRSTRQRRQRPPNWASPASSSSGIQLEHVARRDRSISQLAPRLATPDPHHHKRAGRRHASASWASCSASLVAVRACSAMIHSPAAGSLVVADTDSPRRSR